MRPDGMVVQQWTQTADALVSDASGFSERGRRCRGRASGLGERQMRACFISAASSWTTTASAPKPRATRASPATTTKGPKYTHAAARQIERGVDGARKDLLPSTARGFPIRRL